MKNGSAEQDQTAASQMAITLSLGTIAFVAILFIATLLFLTDARLDESQRGQILGMAASTMIVWTVIYFIRLWRLFRPGVK